MLEPEQISADFREVLRRVLEERRSRNAAYSLRAFSRDLGVSPTALSQILNAKRKFSASSALKVAANLRMNQEQTRDFLSQATSRAIRHTGLVDRRLIADDQFRAIADWYYLAILNLCYIGCDANPKWIARRLGIDVHVAEAVVDRLIRMDLVRVEDKKLQRTTKQITTSEDVPSKAIRIHHKEKLQMAAAALDEVDVIEREFVTITMPASPALMKELKSRIRKFADGFVRATEAGKPTEVYTLNVQFFPITGGRK